MAHQNLMTTEEFDALVELIDSRAHLAASLLEHPNDRSRNDSLRRRAQEEKAIAKAILAGEQE